MKNNKLQFKKALELIMDSPTVFLTMHEGPDGDDLGSVLAMSHFLKQLGRKVLITIKGPVPESLKFLPGSDKVSETFPKEKFDLAITFGSRDLDRVGITELKQF